MDLTAGFVSFCYVSDSRMFKIYIEILKEKLEDFVLLPNQQ